MKSRLNGLNQNILRTLKNIGSFAQRRGLTAYAVGGFVRDAILKRKNFDVDVVVEGDAVAFARALAASLVKEQKLAIKIYKEFGTATFHYANGFRVDFATARREIYRRPGALPEVSPGSICDDLFRRDFTVEARAMVINEDCFGQLVDIFDGLKNLQEGQIRILHNKSFLDDPTRILRAVRFERRFDFGMEPETLTLLKSAIENDYVQYVTRPR